MCLRVIPYLAVLGLFLPATAAAQSYDEVLPFNKPEEYTIRSRSPEDLRNLPAPIPTAPPTVSIPHPDATEFQLTLDDAIRTALKNSEVIRVLTGSTAVSTGQTIYDPAIAHTAIDGAIAQFDPVLSANNSYVRSSAASPTPGGVGFDRFTGNTNVFDVGVQQQNLTGGTGSLTFNDTWSRTGQRGILNPQNQPGVTASYTQPFLSGAGVCANRVPIVLARIQTEQSYFQFKDSYQNLVQSVINGYWNLVFARTDLWARERQVEQALFLFERAEARKRAGFGDAGQIAQRKVALANFRVSLITARASLLDAEAAIKNVLGFPPNDGVRLIPVTAPTREDIEFNWEELVNTATIYRPDLVELKLVLDADHQQIILAKNQAQATLNAGAAYTWNGLTGQFPTGQTRSTGLRNGNYTLSVNFSVPIGLRAARANLRSNELILMRDKANLRQGQHAATHEIAQSLRSLASTYQQYEAFIKLREASLENLQQLEKTSTVGLAEFQVVLQGISDWGNAVSSEALALTTYNSQLAQLEQQTGTILEVHGIRFYEELYGSLGPLGKHGECCNYPKNLRPRENDRLYDYGDRPAEESFNLEEYPRRGSAKKKPQDEDDDWRLDDLKSDDDYEADEFESADEDEVRFEIDRTPRASRIRAPSIPQVDRQWKNTSRR